MPLSAHRRCDAEGARSACPKAAAPADLLDDDHHFWGLTEHGHSRQVHVMQTRDHWSPRHSTLMRQRALVLAILQRGVHDTPPAKPDRITPRHSTAPRPL
jgi:hypothetical protein